MASRECHGFGQSMLPVHDTRGIVDSLLSAVSSGQDLLTAVTSVDGTVNYSYDPTGQLTGATYSAANGSASAVLPNESYAYDANGNPTGSGHVVGADNRLISDGTYTYAYDAEGNRTEKFIDNNHDGVLDAGDTDVTEYAWDARERLTKVTDYAVEGGPATEVVDYLYDVENHCIGETIDSNGDGQVDHQTRFAYDGNQIVLQFDKDGGGTVTGADLSHRYLWQPDVVDQLLADEQLLPCTSGGAGGSGQATGYDVTTPGNVLWALNDQLGTVRDLATLDTQTGITTVANHRVYDSFGNLKAQTNAAVDCLFGFTGQALDSATGLQDNWHRKYDASIGQWISKDPLGFTAGDANIGRYCGNSPANATDPTGCDRFSGVSRMPGVLAWQDAQLYVCRELGYARQAIQAIDCAGEGLGDQPSEFSCGQCRHYADGG